MAQFVLRGGLHSDIQTSNWGQEPCEFEVGRWLEFTLRSSGRVEPEVQELVERLNRDAVHGARLELTVVDGELRIREIQPPTTTEATP